MSPDHSLMDGFTFPSTSFLNVLLSASDLPGKSCPKGSAACLVSSQGAFDMGSPSTPLELLSNDRYLHVKIR